MTLHCGLPDSVLFHASEALCAGQRIDDCHLVAQGGRLNSKNFVETLKTLRSITVEDAKASFQKEISERLDAIEADERAGRGALPR